jgi:hypothetical protein
MARMTSSFPTVVNRYMDRKQMSEGLQFWNISQV